MGIAPRSNDIETRILEALTEVAPEMESVNLDPDKNFRDQIDLDSVDFLQYILALEQKVGIKVPEIDYPKLSSLKGSVNYVESRLAVPS